VDGACQTKRAKRVVVTIDSYEDVPRNRERALLKAVAHQPVSVAIQANKRAFQLYAGGVLTSECGTTLDHGAPSGHRVAARARASHRSASCAEATIRTGVLVVGYGHQNGTAFWKVKNSWGEAWGEEGYIKLARSTEEGPGQCGIAMLPSYPVKEHDNPPRPPKPCTEGGVKSCIKGWGWEGRLLCCV